MGEDKINESSAAKILMEIRNLLSELHGIKEIVTKTNKKFDILSNKVEEIESKQKILEEEVSELAEENAQLK